MQPRFRFLSNIQLRKFSGSEQTYSTDEINCNHQYAYKLLKVAISTFVINIHPWQPLGSHQAEATQSSGSCYTVITHQTIVLKFLCSCQAVIWQISESHLALLGCYVTTV
jgi:hypothetical protein